MSEYENLIVQNSRDFIARASKRTHAENLGTAKHYRTCVDLCMQLLNLEIEALSPAEIPESGKPLLTRHIVLSGLMAQLFAIYTDAHSAMSGD